MIRILILLKFTKPATKNYSENNERKIMIDTSGSCGNFITYRIQSDTLSFTGKGEMKNYAQYSSIPWRSSARSIRTITIEDGIESIGDYVFSYHENLLTISIPDSVTKIGTESFFSFTNLPTISIPKKVTTIGKNAFSYCNSITSLIIPESITIFGQGIFSYCDRLATVNLPENLQFIQM